MFRARGDVVSGRGIRGGTKETDRLIRQAQRAGATLKKAKHGTKVMLNGKVVAAVPGTPSDHRSTKNTAADLKRVGLNARGK